MCKHTYSIKKNKRSCKTFSAALYVAVFVAAFLTPNIIWAATLFFNPSQGEFAVGSSLTVDVLVNSEGQPINNAEAVIDFPSDLLEVLSLSKNGSIFSIWIEGPDYSNATGKISFNGGVPNPGFNGTSGRMFSVVFRAKKAGSAIVLFSSGSVLANDGKGTNVLRATGNASYKFVTGLPAIPETTEPPIASNAPKAPRIYSSTHPDPDRWYSNNNPEFSWEVPADINEVRLLVDKNSFAVPNASYPEPISRRKLDNIADGIWYLHIQLKNKFGWGNISHFKFQIDTKPPQPFEIVVKEGKKTTNPQPSVLFNTTDSLSGVEYYEIKVGEGDFFILSDEIVKNNPYILPLQVPGKRTILVQVFDKAGNYSVATEEISILPIEAPTITECTKIASPGAILSIKGIALPEVTVRIHIQKNSKEAILQEVKSDKDGVWSFIGNSPTELGAYEVWVEAVDSLGAESNPSEKVFLKITPPIFIKVGKLAVDYLAVIITLLGLISVSIFGIYWLWQKIKQIKKQEEKRLRKEITEAEKSLYNAFRFLEKETKEQIAQLDGRVGLSAKEKNICDNLKKALEISEKFVGKEIEDIKKKLVKEEREKGLRKEVTEAERSLYDAFKSLKGEIKEQVAKLDGRVGLSTKEKNICDNLKKALEISEKFVGKEVEDIKKEIENKLKLL